MPPQNAFKRRRGNAADGAGAEEDMAVLAAAVIVGRDRSGMQTYTYWPSDHELILRAVGPWPVDVLQPPNAAS